MPQPGGGPTGVIKIESYRVGLIKFCQMHSSVNFCKAILVFAVLGCASSFSPMSNILSMKRRGPMVTRTFSMMGDRDDDYETRDLTVPDAMKVSPATSRRDWMTNVMKGIGAVAVGIIVPVVPSSIDCIHKQVHNKSH